MKHIKGIQKSKWIPNSSIPFLAKRGLWVPLSQPSHMLFQPSPEGTTVPRNRSSFPSTGVLVQCYSDMKRVTACADDLLSFFNIRSLRFIHCTRDGRSINSTLWRGKFWVGSEALLIECLPSMNGALGSIPSAVQIGPWWQSGVKGRRIRSQVILGYTVTPRPAVAMSGWLKGQQSHCMPLCLYPGPNELTCSAGTLTLNVHLWLGFVNVSRSLFSTAGIASISLML